MRQTGRERRGGARGALGGMNWGVKGEDFEQLELSHEKILRRGGAVVKGREMPRKPARFDLVPIGRSCGHPCVQPVRKS
jgi:hypothetical protein